MYVKYLSVFFLYVAVPQQILPLPLSSKGPLVWQSLQEYNKKCQLLDRHWCHEYIFCIISVNYKYDKNNTVAWMLFFIIPNADYTDNG